MKKISVEEFVDNFFEKIPDVHDVNYMNYNIFTMICNTIEMIEDQDYLKELLFYSKLTEKYYYPDNYDVYYFSAEKNFKDKNANKFPTDKYYFFRQAIALKKEVSLEILEILCEDKNPYVLLTVATRNDLTSELYKKILTSAQRRGSNFPTRGETGQFAKTIALKLPKDFDDLSLLEIYKKIVWFTNELSGAVNFDKKLNIEFDESNKKSWYTTMRKIIEKDVKDLSKKDVESLYFDYVKYNISFDGEYREREEVFKFFLENIPKKLISSKIVVDLEEELLNPEKILDPRNAADEYTLYNYLVLFVKYNLKVNYKKVLSALPSMVKRAHDGLKATSYRNGIPNLYANLCSIKNVDLNLIKEIANNYGYESVYLAIVKNETINISKLNSQLVDNIYQSFKGNLVIDYNKPTDVHMSKGDYSYLEYNRALVAREDTPLAILKERMITTDPFSHLNLLKNPNSDSEIIQYIYDNTQFEYVKNKALRILENIRKKPSLTLHK